MSALPQDEGVARARWVLGLGALLGAGVAAAGLVEAAPPGGVPEGAVAVVDGRVVSSADYERALSALRADRRDGRLRAEDRRRVLERLVDEELLVSRGIELGLARSDRRVRADVVAAVIDQLNAGVDAEPEPDEAQLRAFYRAQAALFRAPPRVALQAAFFGRQEASRAARAARSTEPLTAQGEPLPLPLPTGLVPLEDLGRLLGPSIARVVADLRPGETAAPLHFSGGLLVLRLLAREPGALPPFEARAEAARAEHRRQRGEARLRELLAARRAEVTITVVESP